MAITQSESGFFYRPVEWNRRRPVSENRTGFTGNRKKPVKFKFQIKNDSSTGFHRLADRLGR